MVRNYKSFVFDAKRDETLREDTLFYPLKNDTEENSRRIKAGTSVSTIYSVAVSYDANKNLSN